MSEKRYRVRMSTRGRITIPIELRRQLGHKGGDSIRWRDVPGGVELVFDHLSSD